MYMVMNHNPVQVLKLLKKKQRASAADLGTDKKFMDWLIEQGWVKADGKIKTGRKGKPPTAYVPGFDYNYNEAPAYDAPTQRERKEITQEAIDKVITEVSASSRAKSCSCISGRPGTTAQEIRALGTGCTGNLYVCPSLDAVRRRAGLVNV